MKTILKTIIVVLIVHNCTVSSMGQEHRNPSTITGGELECVGCEVKKFQITKEAAGDDKPRAMKVVVGQEFDYLGKEINTESIEWQLGNWTIKPVSPYSYGLSKRMSIIFLE